MGTTGLIFGAVALAWLAYLVPLGVRRSQQASSRPIDLDARFSDSVRLVRDETDLAVERESEECEVSTPLTRRAILTELKRRDARAAQRTRLGFTLLVTALLVVAGLAIAGVVPAWSPAIPAGLLVAFVPFARLGVRVRDRERAEVLAELRGFAERTEDTVRLSLEDLEPVREPAGSSKVTAVDLGAPRPAGGSSLWDAVPVTAPTYVQAPTPPRTVRTIDLSAPSVPKPVTADPRSAASAVELPEELRDRAVGE